MANKNFSFEDVLGSGWRTTKANLGFFIGVGLLYLISFLPVIAQPSVGLLVMLDVSRSSIYTVAILLKIIEWAIEIVFSIGLIKIALAFCNGRKPAIGTLFNFSDCFWRYTATFILYKLIVIAGMLLLIVPGIFWMTKFCLCFYFVVDRGLGPIKALKASSRTTMGIKWQLLGFIILCTIINILGILCLGLGLLVTYPIVLIAEAIVYRQLAAQTPELAGLGIDKHVVLPPQLPQKRPMAETIFVSAVQTVGVLMLCFILYTVWFFSSKPLITNIYIDELNRMVRMTEDESLNAAPFYNKAAELYKKTIQDSNTVDDLLLKKYDQVTPEQKQTIEKWLADNKEILDLVISGSKKPYYWQTYTEKNLELTCGLISLKELRNSTYSLRWRAQLNAEKGQFEDAFDDIKTSYLIGKHIKTNSATYIEQLVGISIKAVSVDTLRDILGHYQIDSTALATLQKDFEQLTINDDFAIDLKKDKLVFYDKIQRCFTHNYFGSGHLYPKGYAQLTSEFNPHLMLKLQLFPLYILSFVHPGKQQTMETIDCCYAFLGEMAHKTPAQIKAEGINIQEQGKQIAKGNLLLKIFLPPVYKIIEISYRAKVDVESTLPLIAILRYKQDVGDYPENLDKLVEAGYLKKIPIDPFSDKPLGYKKTDDDFIIYSVGLNGVDDGGQPHRDKKGKIIPFPDKGDWIFWPVERN